MIDQRKTLFISDLHLDENSPETGKQFFGFLQACDESIDALYILGDLFEAWIGDDDRTPFHQKVIQALRDVSQKIPVFFLHGNRDFLVGKNFLKETGCQLLMDEEKVELYGNQVLILHGDTLCTRDTNYLRARKILRNRLIQALFLILPLKIRRMIADKLRAKSELYTRSSPMEIMDVSSSEVQTVMQKHEVSYLIHGHTHRPAIHEFVVCDANKTRVVLGAWHNKASILKWYASGFFQLEESSLN